MKALIWKNWTYFNFTIRSKPLPSWRWHTGLPDRSDIRLSTSPHSILQWKQVQIEINGRLNAATSEDKTLDF